MIDEPFAFRGGSLGCGVINPLALRGGSLGCGVINPLALRCGRLSGGGVILPGKYKIQWSVDHTLMGIHEFAS